MSQGIIIKGWLSTELLHELRDMVGNTIDEGGHVILLEGLDKSSAGGDISATEEMLFGNHRLFIDRQSFHQGQAHACSVEQFVEMLQDKSDAIDRWLDLLKLIVVPEGERIFAAPDLWELATMILRDRSLARAYVAPKFIVVMSPRVSSESGIRDAIPLQNYMQPHAEAWEERTHSQGSCPKRCWWIMWKSLNPVDYMNGLVQQHVLQDYGIEPVLAHFAGSHLTESRIVTDKQLALIDQSESLKGAIGSVRFERMTLSMHEDFVGAITVRDATGNPWRVLHAYMSFGSYTLINIVSRNTMLLGYFRMNGQYFSAVPFEPLSPRMSNGDSYFIALLLVRRLLAADRLPVSTIKDALPFEKLSANGDVFKSFSNLILKELGLAEKLATEMSWEWDETEKKFRRIYYMRFVNSASVRNKLPWLRYYSVKDRSGTCYMTIRAEHVTQQLLPKQHLAIDGKWFTIETIDEKEHTIYIMHDDGIKSEVEYRAKLSISTTTQCSKWKAVDKDSVSMNGLKIKTELFSTDFCIQPEGFWQQYSCGWTVKGCSYSEIDGDVSIKRQYDKGRVARFSIVKKDSSPHLNAAAAVALAMWLNEAAIVLFPESWRFFVAVADVEDSCYPEMFCPRLTGENWRRDCSVLIFEDSHSDIGIARGFIDNLYSVLALCLDYLIWLLDEKSGNEGHIACCEENNTPPKSFLAFGAENNDKLIGLEPLKEVLSDVKELNGIGALYKERRRSMGSTFTPLLEEIESEEQVCDFCSADINSGEFEQMSDGRISCKECAKCAVDEKQLEQLFSCAKVFLEAQEARLTVEYHVRFANQDEIAMKLGEVFVPTSEFDARAVGLCRSSQDGTEVLIENGASPEMTACTLVHELTHVWQHAMLDCEKAGLELIEGHALWAETALLEKQQRSPERLFDSHRLTKGASSMQQRHEGSDVYGTGFRILVQEMENAGCNNAYEWMKENYSK